MNKSMQNKLFKSNIGGILFLIIIVIENFYSYLYLGWNSSLIWLIIRILICVGLILAAVYKRKYNLQKKSEEKKQFFWQVRKIFFLLYIFYYVFLSWFAIQSISGELLLAIVTLLYIFILIITNILKKWTHLKKLLYIVFLGIVVEGLLIFSFVAYTYIKEQEKDLSFPLNSVGVMDSNIDYIITEEKDYSIIGKLLLEKYLDNRKLRLEGYSFEFADAISERMIVNETDGGFDFEVAIYIIPSAFSDYWGEKKEFSRGLGKIMTLIVEAKENDRYDLLEMRWK